MSREISHFAFFPKFKDEHTMPFTKGQPEVLSNLRDMAYGWGKVASRRAYGDEGPGLDIDFDSIESLAVEIGQAVIKGAIEETLKTQLKFLGDCQPCPQCARACPVATEPRTIQVRGGTIKYAEPVCRCPACRRDFFPSTPELAARLTQLLSNDPW
jgi:ferredoxin